MPGAAQCSTACTLGQNIAYGYGYSGTGFPSRAVLRGWDKQLVSLGSATSFSKEVPADTAEFIVISSATLRLDLALIPAAVRPGPHLPMLTTVAALNWTKITRWARKLQMACSYRV
jgi:hypothetical protein